MDKELYHPSKGSIPPLFKNRVMNTIFSDVHFSFPLWFFSPIALFFAYRAIWVLHTPVWTFIGLFLLGLFAWTLFEYVLHRWMLHWIPNIPGAKKIHFWLHGIHHDYPADTRVVPPGRSIPGFAVLWGGFYLVCGEYYWPGPLSGFMLGYVWYELIHYMSHNSTWKNKTFRKYQIHHMQHHYRNHHSCYSFTGMFWDRVFRTRLQDLEGKK